MNGKKRGAGLDIGVQKLRLFPIKIVSASTQSRFIEVVDQILGITKNEDYFTNSSKQNLVNEFVKKIDLMVYELYGLSESEILEMEKSNK